MPWSCKCGHERGLLGCSNPNCTEEIKMNPIPAWFPEKEYKHTKTGCLCAICVRNKTIDLCLTAFKENVPTVEEIRNIIINQKLTQNENLKSLSYVWNLATSIHTRLMEGK
jgi:hypothetical protein